MQLHVDLSNLILTAGPWFNANVTVPPPEPTYMVEGDVIAH